eukprot:TRINITY_DN22990_c0_g1_i1.p3 TRINITY_DN22990_c0_g1~~TRINITY_DN22990_c0_g1_i1.p3  ORF type:complete len:188 (+),score=38.08 TRINITY_DN22990_c0_g1_i1:63-626(+)
MPLRADRYVDPALFARLAKRAFRLVEVSQEYDDDGAPVCQVCRAEEAADGGVAGDWSLIECAWCGESAHEVCGGVLQYDKPAFCRACRRVEDSDDEGSQAICVGSASTTTASGEEESLGSLRDMYSEESEEDEEAEESTEESTAAEAAPAPPARPPHRVFAKYRKHVVCDTSSEGEPEPAHKRRKRR